MFPVSDFNFVVAGIATFAATVGYACTRQLGSSLSGPVSPHDAGLEQVQEKVSVEPSSSSSNSDNTTSQDQDITISSQESLKRKIPDDGFDEDNEKPGYPDNLESIYPNKRSRTPSSESDNRRARTRISAASSSSSITSTASNNEDIEIPFVSQEPQAIVTTPAPEPPRTPSPVSDQPSPNPVSPAPTTTAPVVTDPPRPIAALPKRPSTPKTITSSSGGFAAFAGSTSFFTTSTSNPQQQQSTTTASSSSSRPIWTTCKSEDVFDLKKNGGGELEGFGESSLTSSIEAFKKPVKDLEGTLAPSKYTHITGEEEEDVELELKGVKLFVKRGDKSFSDGMMGHVKLLSNRVTLDERILFRREPLWKVSMNIRVQPTVRCSYVAEENVLRVVLKEAVGGTGTVGSSSASAAADSSGSEDKATHQEVVVYALKPGRSCSKHDFKEFAESLVKSSHFKPSSTLTTTTSVTAAAADSSSS